MAASYGGPLPLACNHKWGLWWAEARGRRSEPRDDLVSGVEVLSRRVGGGGALTVGLR